MKRILLADDEEHLRLLVRTTLEDPDHEVIEAVDGLQALEMATRDTPPDLVLLDWMMPGLTGPEVAAELRTRPETARVPVILITAKVLDPSISPAWDLKVDAVLTKPFSPAELIGLVEMLI
ncbi:MAG: response regulator [Bryobacteraceae bacterium]